MLAGLFSLSQLSRAFWSQTAVLWKAGQVTCYFTRPHKITRPTTVPFGTESEPRVAKKGKAATKDSAAGKKKKTAKKASAKKSATKKPAATKRPAKSAKKAADPAAIASEASRICGEFSERLGRRAPSFFDIRWWEDRILSWAMRDESVKVQMFRFADVLPMLKDHRAIARHLEEYFEEVREHLPWAVRMGINISTNNSVLGRALALNARTNADRMARRFTAGRDTASIARSISQLRRQGLTYSLHHIGSDIRSEFEADAYQQLNLELLDELNDYATAWPEDPILDHCEETSLPRVHLGIRLSKLCSGFAPVDAYGSSEAVKERLRPLLQTAVECEAHLQFEIEKVADASIIDSVVTDVLMEKQFREFAHAGVSIQAYRLDTQQRLENLLKWAKKRKTPIGVRLVKGDFNDYEIRTATRNSWPVPIYREQAQTDSTFTSATEFLLKNHEWLKPTIATHNLNAISHAAASAKLMGVDDSSWELQSRYGIAEDQALLLAECGYRVRISTPFGEPVMALSKLARHHLENISHDEFLRTHFDIRESDNDGEKSVRPIEEEEMASETDTASARVPFENEPPTDFSLGENRDLMQQALEEVRSELGRDYALVIGGHAEDGRTSISSRDPSNTSEIIGTVASASDDQALSAIEAASRAWPAWSKTEVQYRVEYLELIAAELRNRRFEMASWIVFECGKPWLDADGEVAEAIDYCMFYADRMRSLDGQVKSEFAGEESTFAYRSRGVCALISPWNSPLSVLTGMLAASLVTGNTVVMKPAEQASVVAAKLMEVVQYAGVPDGVVNYLPGVGDELGPLLTSSPDVDVIAFTGSREAGLEIYQAAATTDDRQRSLTKVIADMGGKNAIIIDDDADMDDAIGGVISSAFGFSGQHCWSCSRVIVLESVYESFNKRLLEAVESLPIGIAEEPGTIVGPIIDSESVERIENFIETIDEEEATMALLLDVDEFKEQGTFTSPVVFTDVVPDCHLAKTELLGPVLSILKARDIDQAIEFSNSSDYALTGGIYSRSPVNIKKASTELQVGNLFINTPITRSLVGRHGFGGYRMSGHGVKSGTADYLMQFLIPVTITENVTRRGINKKS